MKVVVDTNVLVAGLLSPFGPPGEVVRMIASGVLNVCIDARILTEYADVLNRAKFRFQTKHVHALLEQIRMDGLSVAGTPLANRLPDPTDEPFLEIAITGNAACVITGNLKHFPATKRHGMAVLSPAEFLDLYRKHSTRRARP